MQNREQQEKTQTLIFKDMSVNKVILVASVGKDPEVRMAGEAKVATFSVATNEKFKDRQTDEWKENTEWHNIVCWRNMAEIAEKYIKKGTQLYVEGKIRTRSWDDQNGNKRYVTEIVADTIQLLGKRENGDSASAPAPAPQQRVQTTPLPVDDDDLPEGDGLPF